DDGEVTGLLALMLLTEARRPARTAADGALIPLTEQDRGTWNRAYIAEGVALVSDALTRTRLGQYQLQAAIAAVHDEAADTDSTDWTEIRGLDARLRLLESLDGDERLARHHRLPSVRAHLLEMDGQPGPARAAYLAAARRTTSAPEKRYLETRAARLTGS